MKKIFYSIALLSCSLSSYASSTKVQQIQGTSITFNCIPALDTIISAVPSTISFFTMDLTNACQTLSAAAQAYEDAAEAATDFQIQADYYYNAAQAYLAACTLVLTTTSNIGSIGDAQDITYIQSYRCSALTAFNESFESYLQLCMATNSSAIAANAVLALSDFLINIIALNKQNITLLQNLNPNNPEFTSYIQSYQPSSICQEGLWYPIQLPGEDTANCQWKRIQIPYNPTQYTGLLDIYNNSAYDPRRDFNFPASNPDTPSLMSQILGSPGQHILNEYPIYQNQTNIYQTQPNSHNQGMLSSPTGQGTYVAYGNQGSADHPLYDTPNGIGSTLLEYSQILDPYSPQDPKNDSSNSLYDANFANTVSIIPQPHYIYTTPAPATVQNLHDAIRDYMYSADIHKMDSYIYNAYTNITAKNKYPEDVLPAIRRMMNARMNVITCYEGAILKIVAGLTGKTSLSQEAFQNLICNSESSCDASAVNKANAAAKAIIYILPMYTSMIQQITNYDLPLLKGLSAMASSQSSSYSSTPTTQKTAAQAAQQAAASSIQKAQTAYQNAQTNQNANQQTGAQKTLDQQAAQKDAAQKAQQAAAINTKFALAKVQSNQHLVDLATQEAAQAGTQDAQQAATATAKAFQAAQDAANQATTFANKAQQDIDAGNFQAALTDAQQAETILSQVDIQIANVGNAQYKTQKLATPAIQAAAAAQQAAQAAATQAAAQAAAQQAANLQDEIQAYIQQHQDGSKFQMLLSQFPDDTSRNDWVANIIQSDTAWTDQWNAQHAQTTQVVNTPAQTQPAPSVTTTQNTPPPVQTLAPVATPPAPAAPTPTPIQQQTSAPTPITPPAQQTNTISVTTPQQAAAVPQTPSTSAPTQTINTPAQIQSAPPATTTQNTPPPVQTLTPVDTPPAAATPAPIATPAPKIATTNITPAPATKQNAKIATSQQPSNESLITNMIATLFEEYEAKQTK